MRGSDVFRRSVFLAGAVFTGLLCSSGAASGASAAYPFGPAQARLEGSIKYTVIGRYQSAFDRFSGTLQYDPLRRRITSVVLKIAAASIHSRFPKLDRIVRSRRLLDTARYPEIVFIGRDIRPEGAGFRVTGTLQMHGVTQEAGFTFQSIPPEAPGGVLTARGTWVISRKDFGISWNPVLDHGGILVGNHITVDWEVKVRTGQE